MNQILNKNLRLLESYQPDVYHKVNSYINRNYKPANSSIERILLARDGDIVFNMLVVADQQEFLLFNHEDPVGEAYSWIDKYIEPSNKAEIVFGMGFGFHLEVLITSFPYKKVIIAEPNMELFFQILQVRNLELVITKAELFVEDAVENILKRVYELYWDTGKGDIQCEPFDVYAHMFWNSWEELRSKLIKHSQNFNSDIATRRYFAEKWVYNNIKNAEKLHVASNAHGLVGSFRGIPGILVSAGPSLAKNACLLKELQDQCVIIAAGTAVNLLENYGVTPHFMVGIDAGEGEGEIHRRVKSNEIYLIYSNQIATSSLEAYHGPKFHMNYPVDIYTTEFLKYSGIQSEVFMTGPSVSNTCFDILYKMGCNPIIILGQDMAYTSGSHYAGEDPGSMADKIQQDQNTQYILAKDIYGKDVYTEVGFLVIKNWFEMYFSNVKDQVEIINATEGGLGIEYARNSTLKDVIDCLEPDIQNVSARIRQIHEEGRFAEDISDKLKRYKEFVLREVHTLEDLSKEQMRLVDLIRQDVYHPAKDKRAFDKMVSQVSRFTDQVMASPIYHSLLINTVGIEFYIIKREVDQTTKEMKSYSEVKNIYIGAIIRQNQILNDKLGKIKVLLQ